MEEGARPLNEILRAILVELLGPEADPALIRDCANSVLAQCAMYDHSRAVVRRLDDVDVHDPATIDDLAEHVFRFSLGGIRALAEAAKSAEHEPPMVRGIVRNEG